MGKSTHGNKEIQTLNLHKDARDMLHKQAKEANLSISNYVERLIIEKNIQKKEGYVTEFENI